MSTHRTSPETHSFSFTEMIDLSVVPDAPHEPWKPKIHYLTHEREGLDWIKVIGVDMYALDRKFEDMAKEFRETKDGRLIWEAHFAGIEREYCQIEKLANKIPRPSGIKVACFPTKVQGASGGWCRPVALV